MFIFFDKKDVHFAESQRGLWFLGRGLLREFRLRGISPPGERLRSIACRLFFGRDLKQKDVDEMVVISPS
jgi:hypothetical protein